MDASDFTSAMTGRLVEVPAGPPDVRYAFVPNPLPPSWDWPQDLWPLLLDAHRRLASLDGTGKHLAHPEILLTPLQIREAHLSSQLEGTITDPQQQALFDAAPRFPAYPNESDNALREVFNYRRALRMMIDGSEELPLSLRLIRKLHAILMEGVRGSDRTPGEFRRTQNQIGRPARFVPPPPLFLPETLDAFEKYLHTADAYDPLVKAFLVHYQFETIHPFSDGNGRVGRLLLALTAADWCGLSGKWLYMSPYFEKHKARYMDLLLKVSTHGDWTSWIRFCLEGVVSQSIDAEKRCERLLRAHRDFHSRLRGGSVRLSAIVDGLFRSPVVSVNSVRDKLDVSYPTARADLRRLESLGILTPLHDAPVISYYSPEIYRITHEDIA